MRTVGFLTQISNGVPRVTVTTGHYRWGMDCVPAAVLDHLDAANPGGVLGVYLYGSAASTGL